MGEKVEVLEPQELREDIKRRLEECLTKYNN
jgi:predicted DNA-binding transcriptional regulator YafY